jgi:hypothetical protein
VHSVRVCVQSTLLLFTYPSRRRPPCPHLSKAMCVYVCVTLILHTYLSRRRPPCPYPSEVAGNKCFICMCMRTRIPLMLSILYCLLCLCTNNSSFLHPIPERGRSTYWCVRGSYSSRAKQPANTPVYTHIHTHCMSLLVRLARIV